MSFVVTNAEDLGTIEPDSIDVVTTRSVLIYVADKGKAFREFHRVLRPGGRVSIFEPINNYFPDTTDEFWGFDSKAVNDLVAKLFAYERYEGWESCRYESDPMMNFTEKDLVAQAEAAGFAEVHVELLIDVEPGTWVLDWGPLAQHLAEPERAYGRGGDPWSSHPRRGREARAPHPTPRRQGTRDPSIGVRVSLGREVEDRARIREERSG